MLQARPGAAAAAAAAAAELRDLRLLAAGRGRAPARRADRSRRPALVGSPRGLPHRGARADEGADGQERGDRPVRREGRLRRQAPAGGRRRGAPRRGRRLLPDLRLEPARHHRQHRRRGARGARSASCATTATTPTWSSPPTRGPPPSPTSPTRSRPRTPTGWATRSPPGGSVGYDHKKMGITARGAWESVKRHFRELGRNIKASDFTVVGIGDMSGDVFGNGMLLSPHIRLVGGVQPRPRLPRPRPRPGREPRRAPAPVRAARAPRGATTTRALISAGRRRLPAQREVDRALGAGPRARSACEARGADARRGDPRAAARARRPALERRHRHLREGRRRRPTPRSATRPTTRVRVDGRELRCRVVGEGGNLGFTQRGRIEYAIGGRAHQHRRDRQRRRRQLLRPRGQHQDPARRGGARRRADGGRSATSCWWR